MLIGEGYGWIEVVLILVFFVMQGGIIFRDVLLLEIKYNIALAHIITIILI